MSRFANRTGPARWKWKAVTSDNTTWHGFVHGMIEARAIFGGVDSKGKTSWTAHFRGRTSKHSTLSGCQKWARALRKRAYGEDL